MADDDETPEQDRSRSDTNMRLKSSILVKLESQYLAKRLLYILTQGHWVQEKKGVQTAPSEQTATAEKKKRQE